MVENHSGFLAVPDGISSIKLFVGGGMFLSSTYTHESHYDIVGASDGFVA